MLIFNLIVSAYIFFSAISIDLYLTGFLFIASALALKNKFNLVNILLVFLILTPVSLIEWNYRVDTLNKKSQAKEYTCLNVAGVYNLTFLMATTGYISGYKETGFEMLYFALPSTLKKNNITFNSDFAMESDKIVNYIKKHKSSGRSVSYYNLSWTRKEHTTDSSRVALALNGASKLKITTRLEGKKTIYDCQIDTNFHMNDIETKMKLGKYTILRIPEGVFSGMQKINAFTPYRITRKWSVDKKEINKKLDIYWVDDFIEDILTPTK